MGQRNKKKEWLLPLLDGQIKSCFAMTEPDQASSDAINISATITRDGDYYVINGRKWWITGAANPRCKLIIFLGRSNPDAEFYRQHSMILVPFNTPGVRVLRNLTTFGFDDLPFGHCEMEFTNVRVPASNMLLGEGKGFEIAQGRLGPGRIHHCMRLIGLSERCLELMVKRVHERSTFGQKLARHGTIMADVAKSRSEVDQARLLVMNAAHAIDVLGNRAARGEIASIKFVTATMACNVIDRAIQAYGGAGVCQDFVLAGAYVAARCIRLADGPDEVHARTIAQIEYRTQKEKRKQFSKL